MPREAQAMMVTLLCSARLSSLQNAKISDQALDDMFDLSEKILLKAEERDRKRNEGAPPPFGHVG